MIDRKDNIFDLCRIFGSVIPRALPWAIIGAIEGALLDASDWQLFKFRNGPNGSPEQELWHHPYSVHVFGMVIGFALVMRVQIAYARFWEGATNLRIMSSKLGDAITQLLAFDEVPPLGPAIDAVTKGKALPGGANALPAVLDESAFDFRLQVVHFGSLFHACALIEIRGDDAWSDGASTLNTRDPYLFRVLPTGASSLGDRITSTRASSARPKAEEQQTSVSAFLAPASAFLTPASAGSGDAASDADTDSPTPARLRWQAPSSVDASDGSLRLPSALGATMPLGWVPGAPVPLQQVIRARRVMNNDAQAPDSGGSVSDGDDAAATRTRPPPPSYDSVALYEGPGRGDVESQGDKARRQSLAIQPRSVWNPATPSSRTSSSRSMSRTDLSLHRGLSFHRISQQFTTSRNSQGPETSPDEDSAHGGSAYRKSSTGRGGTARAGSANCLEYVNAVLLLRPTRRALAKLATANCFDVVGGVSAAEMELLLAQSADNRAFIVMNWLLRLMSFRMRQGGLAIPAPLLSRTYQILSDAVLGWQQSSKLEQTPFPYPLRQLLALLLLAFQALVPMCIAAFVDSPPLVATLSFFVCLGYSALNETARELEHPFGLGANHLPVVAYQDAFNSKICRLLELNQPSLGYLPTHSDADGESLGREESKFIRGRPPTRVDSSAAIGVDDFV